jgi:hypothetical protein
LPIAFSPECMAKQKMQGFLLFQIFSLEKAGVKIKMVKKIAKQKAKMHKNTKSKMQKMQSPVFISYSFYKLSKQNYYSQILIE